MLKRPRLALALALLSAFVAGNVTAGALFATSINKGLVNAFSSVGENLFGAAAFEASFVPPNPVYPNGSVQLYLAQDVRLGTGVNVFAPPSATPTDPCRSGLQIRVVPPNPTVPPNPIQPVEIVVDPDVFGDDIGIVYESLADYRPSLARCQASCGVDGCLP
jgi:hypothetical protein